MGAAAAPATAARAAARAAPQAKKCRHACRLSSLCSREGCPGRRSAGPVPTASGLGCTELELGSWGRSAAQRTAAMVRTRRDPPCATVEADRVCPRPFLPPSAPFSRARRVTNAVGASQVRHNASLWLSRGVRWPAAPGCPRLHSRPCFAMAPLRVPPNRPGNPHPLTTLAHAFNLSPPRSTRAGSKQVADCAVCGVRYHVHDCGRRLQAGACVRGCASAAALASV